MGRKKSEEWEYVTILKKLPKGMCTMKCKFCEHEWDGGPSRIRAHILELKGFGVDKCKSPPKHVKDVVQRLHVGLQANTPGAEIDAEVANLEQLGETFAGVEFDATGGMSSSVNVSASSSKKRKASGSQGILTQSWNLQARKNANMAVRRFFYAEDIPHLKVKSPYFVDMLRAVGEVGSSYKPPYEQLRGKELLEELLLYKEIKKKFQQRPWLDVVSKADLLLHSSCSSTEMHVDSLEFYKVFGPEGALHVSIQTGLGIDELKQRVLSLLSESFIERGSNSEAVEDILSCPCKEKPDIKPALRHGAFWR
ncbi:hypothetical protein L7F22_015605 [Adiantum nelumboides]|nr:hypothetical protein [Adiantum nelumboides]